MFLTAPYNEDLVVVFYTLIGAIPPLVFTIFRLTKINTVANKNRER